MQPLASADNIATAKARAAFVPAIDMRVLVGSGNEYLSVMLSIR
ncbi:hypothetical protein SS05631_c09800 [Sinorhizobium sp. CCBAU 05631]|nr:hypothetical protein SS05631_c09800 [Sinorhizobium sp. CCBAU 05631]